MWSEIGGDQPHSAIIAHSSAGSLPGRKRTGRLSEEARRGMSNSSDKHSLWSESEKSETDYNVTPAGEEHRVGDVS